MLTEADYWLRLGSLRLGKKAEMTKPVRQCCHSEEEVACSSSCELFAKGA